MTDGERDREERAVKVCKIGVCVEWRSRFDFCFRVVEDMPYRVPQHYATAAQT
jgi:hypothetical protein